MKNAPRIETEVVAYHYNLDNEADCQAYGDMSHKLESEGQKLMRVYSLDNSNKKIKSGPVVLDTNFLFNNQWNTTDDSPTNPKFRIFNWYETVVPNKKIRQGHYTVVTQEMTDILNAVFQCGFCGNMEWAQEADDFCIQCLGSPYLSSNEVHLTLTVPVSKSFGADRQAMIDNDHGLQSSREEVKAKYLDAQAKLSEQKIAKERKEVAAKYESALEKITIERDGMDWLLDNGINTDNVIFYSHNKAFCFDWRNPLSHDVKERLKEALKDFPFKVEFK
jgi:hypothetical protein